MMPVSAYSQVLRLGKVSEEVGWSGRNGSGVRLSGHRIFPEIQDSLYIRCFRCTKS